MARSVALYTMVLLPLVPLSLCTSDGHLNCSVNSISPSPAPSGANTALVMRPNMDEVEDFQVLPPSRVSSMIDTCGHSRRAVVVSGLSQSGFPESSARGGALYPVIRPTFGVAKLMLL